MPLEFPDTLRALRSRNYRLFFMAQAISLTGLWMHRTAMGWLVYRLTGSNSALGIMDFAASIPIFFLTAVAGALLERWDLRKSLFLTQFCSMCTAFALAVATFTGLVTFTFTVCCAVFLGLLDAFEIPCRYSLVSYMVDRREDVANGVALNSVNFNATRMFGPTLAGFMIHAFGEGVCFLFNGIAYSSTLFAVSRMKMKRPPVGRSDGSEPHPIADTLEGIRLAKSFAPAKYLLILISLTGFFAFPSLVLMPAMARTVLGGTSETYGFLLMGVAVGALTGSLLMASLKSTGTLAWWCTRMCAAFGIAVVLFSFSRSVLMGIILAAPIGFTMVTNLIACNSLLQTMIPADSRSRILALYSFAVIGIPPFGSLLSGKLGDLLGTNWSLFICGVCCMIFAFYYMKKLDGLKDQIAAALKSQGAL